jgi:7-cyano-7-deazaguanine synthase
VLTSGGLDSCILINHLLRQGRLVQPIYVRSGLIWEPAELQALQRYLAQLSSLAPRDLVVLELPLTDLYGEHWSLTGVNPPGKNSPDEEVFLPGRNVLLAVKGGLWCQMNGIRELALAVLGTSPFGDAKGAFFEQLQAVFDVYREGSVRFVLPFADLSKPEVMQLGRGCPLELTFSCISPVRDRHCGQCNKCAERRQAFRSVGWDDPTTYAGDVGAA